MVFNTNCAIFGPPYTTRILSRGFLLHEKLYENLQVYKMSMLT